IRLRRMPPPWFRCEGPPPAAGPGLRIRWGRGLRPKAVRRRPGGTGSAHSPWEGPVERTTVLGRTGAMSVRSPDQRPIAGRRAPLGWEKSRKKSPLDAGFFPGCREGSVRAVQVAQLRGPRGEVGGEVGDLLVGQVAGLLRHQRMLAVAAAVLVQGVRQVVGVLATDPGIAVVERVVAVGAVAIDARLAGRRALGIGQGFAFGDAAIGEAGDGGGPALAGGVGSAAAGDEDEGEQACSGQLAETVRLDHGVSSDRKAAMSAMSWSEKLRACTSMVGCLRVPLRYSLSALLR